MSSTQATPWSIEGVEPGLGEDPPRRIEKVGNVLIWMVNLLAQGRRRVQMSDRVVVADTAHLEGRRDLVGDLADLDPILVAQGAVHGLRPCRTEVEAIAEDGVVARITRPRAPPRPPSGPRTPYRQRMRLLLLAEMSWPPGATPEGRSMLARKLALGDHHGNVFARHHDFAAGDQAIVGVDHHRIVDIGVELDDGAPPHLEKLMDRHLGLAQDHRYFNAYATDRAHFVVPNHHTSVATIPWRNYFSVNGRRPTGGRQGCWRCASFRA